MCVVAVVVLVAEPYFKRVGETPLETHGFKVLLCMPGMLTPVCSKAGVMHFPLDGHLRICSLNSKVFPYSLNTFSARTYYILAAGLAGVS